MYLKTYLTILVTLALIEIDALPQEVINPKSPVGKEEPQDRTCKQLRENCLDAPCCPGLTCYDRSAKAFAYKICLDKLPRCANGKVC